MIEVLTKDMGRSGEGMNRQRGSIDRLRSGALRVRVYAGIDPMTKKRHNLTEIIPPGPRAAAQAEAARVRFVHEVNERRNSRTNATVGQLLTRRLDTAELEHNTRETCRGYARRHITSFLANVKVGALDADILDSFYAELRRCRDHCSGGGSVDHRTMSEHSCDSLCRRHVCRPLSASTIRQIDWILSGALRRAV
ncbi:MAG: hypothetical protein ACRD1H_17450 [Vicinamibacterales bacterium]